MGLIRTVKLILEMKRVKKMIEEEEEVYRNMTKEEVLQLDDVSIVEAIICRIESKVDQYDEIGDGVAALSEEEKIVYTVDYFESEVNNGGLCQFFINSSKAVAPFVSDSLEKIGAIEHKELYDQFIIKNKIDVNDLSEFKAEEYLENEEIYDEKYPFEDFDSSFYELEYCTDKLKDYIVENIDSFFL